LLLTLPFKPSVNT